ncbi:sulfur carrier protein ThiS [Halomonas sp. M4R5S39]|uniref:Thiamine biosynthesis protein ThiS n=2 Tax=Halomonas TaxID=2745 RepID=A0A2N7TGN0_9GAMM|nr:MULTISPECIES: sulfur carrier protein ThiS [Halomonas]MDI5933409.1 sulfur carrier protein ThiS [Halomonas kalidii]MDI5983839.1 sulfur carrier protein ThiS [Halomonas kalidii]PMR67344.1 thiamine biosynthesis protein ThiS [Halomonas heilongjiangensis]PXX88120.1 thiamine biosynthesis protein ThiS [Halomonas heilongjiangensis]
MRVWINGECRLLNPETTIHQLLVAHELQRRRVAVELNEEIVPRSRHDEVRISDGDRIEIVHAIGGG